MRRSKWSQSRWSGGGWPGLRIARPISIVLVALVDAVLELFLGLTKRSSQLRQTSPTEEHEHDDQDDDEFWRSESHAVKLPVRPSESTAVVH